MIRVSFGSTGAPNSRIRTGASTSTRALPTRSSRNWTGAVVRQLLKHLCSVLAARYGVAESSVRVYAAAPIFARTASGAITLRPDGVPFEFDDDPATSSACFRHEDHWSLRMPVTSDLLRGSGRSIPTQFAAYLGCQPGRNKELATAWGDVRVAWPLATPWPSIGSIRPALAATDAEEADILFLCYDPRSEELDLRVIKRATDGGLPVDQRISNGLGLHKVIVSMSDIAEALSVEHRGLPESIVRRDVQTALQVRSSLDIGGLLAEYSPELTEPLAPEDALRRLGRALGRS